MFKESHNFAPNCSEYLDKLLTLILRLLLKNL